MKRNVRVLLFCVGTLMLGCDHSQALKDAGYTRGGRGLYSSQSFEHNGHRYLYFEEGASSSVTGGAVHDPDCPCNANASSGKVPRSIGAFTVDEFEFNGHDYLYFEEGAASSVTGGPVHSPTCRKCAAY